MSPGRLSPGSAYSVMAPDVVIFPILLVPWSAYQRFPSGPCATALGWLWLGSAYYPLVAALLAALEVTTDPPPFVAVTVASSVCPMSLSATL
jgi:hypothetical protein